MFLGSLSSLKPISIASDSVSNISCEYDLPGEVTPAKAKIYLAIGIIRSL